MRKFAPIFVHTYRQMRLFKTIYMLLLAALLVLASCKAKDDYEVTLYNDATITAFSLGTLNRYVDGVKTTVTGSNYKFVIDQEARDITINGVTKQYRLIENPDSLPTNTDNAHVVTSVSAMNNGVVGIYDVEDPTTIKMYSSTDSIDYSKDRVFVVYSSSGKGYSEYLVKVNVHKEEGEEFVWKLMEDVTLPAEEPVVLPAGIKQIIGSSTHEMYALSDDNILKVSGDGGISWEDETYENDDDAALLPTQDISMVCYPMTLAEKTDYVLMAGNREVQEKQEDGTTKTVLRSSVWRKIVDYGDGTPKGRWTYLERESDAQYLLPGLKGLTLVRYDDTVLAFGGDYSEIYQSRDNGITWKENKVYQMPEDFDDSTTGVLVRVDSDNFIWLYCEGTGQIWRGRLNRLGWK